MNENLWQWLWLVMISFLGGMLGFIARNDLSDMSLKQKIKNLILGIITSMFIAYITYEIALYVFDKNTLAVAIAGLGAYMGTNALVILENAFISFIEYKARR